MKKFIWKIRYALEIKRYGGTTWAFARVAAYVATEDWLEDDWFNWVPECAAREEMSYWDVY